MKINWIDTSTEAENGNSIIEKFDIELYSTLALQYQNESIDVKKQYNGIDDYIVRNGGPAISSAQKNYKKICDEIKQKQLESSYSDRLVIDVYSEKDTITDLLSSLENVNYIKSIYKKKKLMVSKGLNTDVASKIMDCMRQGRSLLKSSQTADMLSKPLIDFYAASAYAYAAIVINSPVHKSLDSLRGSHGHTYNHKNGSVEFGGNTPSGTFLDLFIASYESQIVTDNVHLRYYNLDSIEYIQKHNNSISLIALFSSIPELREQVTKLPTGRRLVYELTVDNKVVNDKVSYEFQIGDGHMKPNVDNLTYEFHTDRILESHGKYKITIPSNNIGNISPTIYQDIHGNYWYVEPIIKRLCIPEVCTHFLIISALCNIMRYSYHVWNDILSNKISSEFSLLVSKYLRLFEIKFPMLLTQLLTDYTPIIRTNTSLFSY